MRIFFGAIKSVSNDKGPFVLAQVIADGKTRPAELISLYGNNFNPPNGSRCLLIEADGDGGKLSALVIDDPALRFDGHKEGEVRTGNTMTGTNTLLNDQGDMVK